MEVGKILSAFVNRTSDEKYQFLKNEFGTLLKSSKEQIPQDVLDLLFAVTYYIRINPTLLRGLSYVESLVKAGFKNPRLDELKDSIAEAHKIAREIFISTD